MSRVSRGRAVNDERVFTEGRQGRQPRETMRFLENAWVVWPAGGGIEASRRRAVPGRVKGGSGFGRTAPEERALSDKMRRRGGRTPGNGYVRSRVGERGGRCEAGE